jgi:hypothetical protein
MDKGQARRLAERLSDDDTFDVIGIQSHPRYGYTLTFRDLESGYQHLIGFTADFTQWQHEHRKVRRPSYA